MSKATVEVTISATVTITDGGYLRNSVIEDHIKAAKDEVAHWQVGINKKPGRSDLVGGDTYEPVNATFKVNRVILVEDD